MNKPLNKTISKSMKLIPIGNSTGAIFPKELLRELGLEAGDSVFPVRTPNGIELRTGDPEFEGEMEILRDVMRRRRSALRELAK